ncbi:cysteine--tRNA ligase CPS1 homolog, chloroplastic/mitochondrial-like isoform X2 [Papaver somniferum]|uniref:cysteine--tRNA ligase CPS1 homolog, chloroplastic/mitochondrial-like isoform X2 n=1 Tax=Papaver somniferum TaxID=3469 RepID=UPI000E6F6698|nr:cysteine--tRNA ligase CPS1 homolog, chloroplastic/mitochondrial-like isoform X2 [Papaver somniferum]
MAVLLKCYRPVLSLNSNPVFGSKKRIALQNYLCRYTSERSFSEKLLFRKKNSSFIFHQCISSFSPPNQASISSNNSPKQDVSKSDLWIYNTMTRQKELFKPKVPGQVGMYVCGVTSYDLSHIGHARVYVSFDVLFRYLRYLEYEVCYVRNFTDVDDKIIARANELGEDPLRLSRRYCDEFHYDMEYLHCLPPTMEPYVSDHMVQIIDMIKKILDNGCAYRVDGDVYFSVEQFPNYGQLSGRKLEDNRAGERVAVDSRKKNPADFALWKSAKEGEPFWESPWGPGRPGWHIECSAMSAAYLGHTFDIHGGGMDLVFPHHENEIAQSCAACDKSNISYWMHNGFVTVDSEKMSKSLGNFFTIREVIDLYHPLALRIFLMGTHYRSPINYSEMLLESASDRAFYIYQFFKGKKRQKRIESLSALEKEIRSVLAVLGLMPASYSEVLQQLREKALKRAALTEDDVQQKINARNSARENKEYENSDAIRKELAALGIALMDSPDGTVWRPTVPLALQE